MVMNAVTRIRMMKTMNRMLHTVYTLCPQMEAKM